MATIKRVSFYEKDLKKIIAKQTGLTVKEFCNTVPVNYKWLIEIVNGRKVMEEESWLKLKGQIEAVKMMNKK